MVFPVNYTAISKPIVDQAHHANKQIALKTLKKHLSPIIRVKVKEMREAASFKLSPHNVLNQQALQELEAQCKDNPTNFEDFVCEHFPQLLALANDNRLGPYQKEIQKAFLKFCSSFDLEVKSHPEDDKSIRYRGYFLALILAPESLRPSSPLFDSLNDIQKDFALRLVLNAHDNQYEEFDPIRTQLSFDYKLKPLNQADIDVIKQLAKSLRITNQSSRRSTYSTNLPYNLGQFSVNQGDEETIKQLMEINDTLFPDSKFLRLIASKTSSDQLRQKFEDKLLSKDYLENFFGDGFEECIELVNQLSEAARVDFFSKFIDKICKTENNDFRTSSLYRHRKTILKKWGKLNASERDKITSFIIENNPLLHKAPPPKQGDLVCPLSLDMVTQKDDIIWLPKGNKEETYTPIKISGENGNEARRYILNEKKNPLTNESLKDLKLIYTPAGNWNEARVINHEANIRFVKSYIRLYTNLIHSELDPKIYDAKSNSVDRIIKNLTNSVKLASIKQLASIMPGIADACRVLSGINKDLNKQLFNSIIDHKPDIKTFLHETQELLGQYNMLLELGRINTQDSQYVKMKDSIVDSIETYKKCLELIEIIEHITP